MVLGPGSFRKKASLPVRTAALSACMLLCQAGAFAPPNLPAQSKTKAAQEPLQNQVTVTVKLVQVYVTDAKGNPARDLEISDFILYDNGRLQTVTGFEKHFLALPTVTLAETKPGPAREVPSLMNRKFLFLIDYESNDLEGIAKSRNAVLKFLDTQVRPGDEIALFSYSYWRGLVVHEYFTSDTRKIRSTLDKVMDTPGVVRGWESSGDPDHDVMGMERMTMEIFGSENKGNPQTDPLRFSECLGDLAKALRHIPGQKNIVFFSRGFGIDLTRPKTLGTASFVDLGKELSSANAPVFAVNTTTGVNSKIALGVFPNPSLEYLSTATGGKYFYDVNYYAKNAEAIHSATSNYYVLGYSVAANWDGKFHDIKVEIKRPGCKVYAQKGYFNPLPFNKLSAAEKHFQLMDLALGEQAYFAQHMNFPMIGLPFGGNKGANAILLSEIPVLRIREVVGDNTEMISLIFDQNKTLVDSSRSEINWATTKGETIYQYAGVSLAPGQYDCRIVIRNQDDGRGAVGACAVEMPKSAEGRLSLYPPLLLVPGSGAQYLNISIEKKGASTKGVALPQIYPFPLADYVPVIDGMEPGSSSIAAALRYTWQGEQGMEPQISAWIETEKSGARIALTSDLLGHAKSEDADFLLLEFGLSKPLPPGRYTLHIAAEDPVTKSRSETATELRVKERRGAAARS